VSETEGLPISIKEVQSCGIPVVGTSVGGIPEIVSNDNGLLLPENPSTHEVGNAIAEFVRNPAKALEKRSNTFNSWKENSDEQVLNQRFVEELTAMAKEGPSTEILICRKREQPGPGEGRA